MLNLDVIGFRALRDSVIALLGLGFLFLSGTASAGCDPRDFGNFHVKLPAGMYSGPGSPSIVGLWHAVYTATDGTNFGYQSFDVWHADGTEFESADLPPVVGALCVGVYKQNGRNVELNHFGWTWDPSGLVPTGSFNLRLILTVSEDGRSYSGTFDFKPYDTNGNFESSGEHKGSLTAARITMGTTGGD